MRGSFWGSWISLRFAQRSALLLLFVLAGAAPAARRTGAGDDRFVTDAVQHWCDTHGGRDDLQVAVIDVRFHAEPPLFARGEGVVVAPVGLELPGAQRVLEVASEPASTRRLTAGGITALAWEYAGRTHREMRFVGLVGAWSTKVPVAVRLVASRIVDNWGLLFPDVAALIVWPRAGLPAAVRPPWPAWSWEGLHALAAVAFWVVLGYWTYRRYDFGSRIPTK